MNLLKRIIILTSLAFILSACSDKPHANWGGRIMVLSISSDGHYVISSDVSQHVVLWDLVQRSYRVVANHANIYSAYFIKNTHDFIYQSNQDNTVYVENVEGKILQKLHPGFPTYGEAMTSDLQNYYAADIDYRLFAIRNGQKQQLLYAYCGPEADKPQAIKNKLTICAGFIAYGKLFNIEISPNEKYMVTSGSSEYYLWNLTELKLVKDIVKNNGTTFAAISPSNDWIFSADIAFWGYKYNINTREGKNFYYTTGFVE